MTDVSYQIEKLEEKAAGLKNAVSQTRPSETIANIIFERVEKILGSSKEI